MMLWRSGGFLLDLDVLPLSAITPMPTETAPLSDTRFVIADDGDHDTFAHYVKIHALIEGGECVALCGKRWIPKKVAEGYPVCPDCKRIYDAMPEGPS